MKINKKFIIFNHSIKRADLNKCIFITFIISTIFLSGCAVKNIYSRTDSGNNEYITITGTAEETKDGYYVAGYVLGHEEIQKSEAKDISTEYGSRKIEVTGKIKEVNPQCTLYEQCRKGPYKVIYDVQSIKIIE